MAITPIDQKLYTGLTKMQRAYDAVLSVRGAAIDRYNAKKTTLDEEWQAELEPVLRDLYWHPFRNGISEAPEDGRKLKKWLKDEYRDAAIITLLLLLLRRYHLRAANLGGQTALDLLGIDATFNLTNDAYLQQMIDRAEMLTTIGSEQSLIDTTIDDLAIAIPAARQNDGGVLAAISAYIASRAIQRTVMIERYERPCAAVRTMDQAYSHNGITNYMYDVNGVGCIQKCAEWHGRVNPAVYIPQHTGCDCIWSAIRYDGQVVGTPPVTVSVPGLQPWTPPATIWTGGNQP